MAERKRIQLELSEEAYSELEKLKLLSGSTNAMVIRNALKLYKFAKEEEKNASKLIVESKDGEKRQILIP